VQRCKIKQDFRVAKKALKLLKVRWGRGGGLAVGGGGRGPGRGVDTCKAWVAKLVF
jgi:hypothetical protein